MKLNPKTKYLVVYQNEETDYLYDSEFRNSDYITHVLLPVVSYESEQTGMEFCKCPAYIQVNDGRCQICNGIIVKAESEQQEKITDEKIMSYIKCKLPYTSGGLSHKDIVDVVKHFVSVSSPVIDKGEVETIVELLDKLDFKLDEVRAKVAGLGVMSTYIRDIKHRVLALSKLRYNDRGREMIEFAEWISENGWYLNHNEHSYIGWFKEKKAGFLYPAKYIPPITTAELLTKFNNRKDK